MKVGFRLISALGISNTGTVTDNIALDKDEVAEEVTGLVEDFVVRGRACSPRPFDFDLLFNFDDGGERSEGARARVGGRF
ncbi:hypothetical protein [Rhizobium sp. TRM95796]|uniref:hypothetical protein n=1 Tax=Rhizobium sp. TRM95796 TaxID=2979862 RepID=UPI00399367DB